ncbi:MAG: hypothetical protein ACRCWQ_00980 [Bacilli bacterium]
MEHEYSKQRIAQLEHELLHTEDVMTIQKHLEQKLFKACEALGWTNNVANEKIDAYSERILMTLSDSILSKDQVDRLIQEANQYDTTVRTVTDLRRMGLTHKRRLVERYRKRAIALSLALTLSSTNGSSLSVGMAPIAVYFIYIRYIYRVALIYGYHIRTPNEVSLAQFILYYTIAPFESRDELWEKLLLQFTQARTLHVLEIHEKLSSAQLLVFPLQTLVEQLIVWGTSIPARKSKLSILWASMISLWTEGRAEHRFKMIEKVYEYRFLKDNRGELFSTLTNDI